MLREISVAQQTGRRRRRWFEDEDFDLIVWFGQDGVPDGFQLCYDCRRHERALTWTEDAGYRHDRIDDGEGNPSKNRSPILIPENTFPVADVLERFEVSSTEVDSEIKQFVAEKLQEYARRAGPA